MILGCCGCCGLALAIGGGKDSLRSCTLELLCGWRWWGFCLSNFALVEAGGQMGPGALEVPLCISRDGVLVLVCLCCLLGTGVS